MNDTAEIILKQFLKTLKVVYNLDEPRLKVVEEECRKAVLWVLADQKYDRRETEQKRSLPPPVDSHRGRRHEPRRKTKSVSELRESDEPRRELSRLLLVRMDQQATRARGGRAADPPQGHEADGLGGQAQDQAQAPP